MYEHIVAAELCLGRPLEPGEVVHHHDGDFSNNHHANIVVFPGQSEHIKYHWAVKQKRCKPGDVHSFGGITFADPPRLSIEGPRWMKDLVERIIVSSQSSRRLAL